MVVLTRNQSKTHQANLEEMGKKIEEEEFRRKVVVEEDNKMSNLYSQSSTTKFYYCSKMGVFEKSPTKARYKVRNDRFLLVSIMDRHL